MTTLEKAAASLRDDAAIYGSVLSLDQAKSVARAVLLSVSELPDCIVEEHLSSNEYGFGCFYGEAYQPAIEAVLNEEDRDASESALREIAALRVEEG